MLDISNKIAYKKASGISEDIIAVYWKWMQNSSFKSAYEKLYYRNQMRQGEEIGDQEHMFALMSDLAKCNAAIGYTPTMHDQASMAMYQVMMRLFYPSMAGYKGFKLMSADKSASKLILELYADYVKNFADYKDIFGLAEILREFSHPYMNFYLDTLQRYTRHVAKKTNAEPDALRAWIDKIESMKDHSIPSSGIACIITEDSISSSAVTSGPSCTVNIPKAESGSDFWDMTKDYYGKHGEFDINDEARRVSEDIQQFHNANPDTDLADHYYWDDILDAKTDGYLDD